MKNFNLRNFKTKTKMDKIKKKGVSHGSFPNGDDYKIGVADPSKTYINSSKFIEFIDEIATQLTEERYGEEMFEDKELISYVTDIEKDKLSYPTYTEEAQYFYNETFSSIETMANKIMSIYSDIDMTLITKGAHQFYIKK